MLGQHSVQSHWKTHIGSRDRKCAIPVLPSPQQNHLLAALPRQDYERLMPHLQPVTLPVGWTVYGSGEQQKYLYFPIAGIVSSYIQTMNGASSQCAIKGSEGVVGLALLLGGKSTPRQTLVLSAGFAYRLEANQLKNELEHGGALLGLLLRYTQALMTQTMQLAVCNRHHSLMQQLCCWILSCLDRLPSNELVMTQERIAEMLGVRREGVTAAAGTLQRAGLIHYHRGHIAVDDRLRLEAGACECYSIVKHEYDRLLSGYAHKAA